MKAPIKCPMCSEPFCIAYFEPFNIHYFHSHFLGSRGPESGLRITFFTLISMSLILMSRKVYAKSLHETPARQPN